MMPIDAVFAVLLIVRSRFFYRCSFCICSRGCHLYGRFLFALHACDRLAKAVLPAKGTEPERNSGGRDMALMEFCNQYARARESGES